MCDKNERRKYKRIRIEQVDADYRLVDFNFWAESRSRGHHLLKDISVGGMSFNTEDALPKDTLMSLNLKLGDMIKIGDIYGRVVRISRLDDGKYDIGINFSWWDRDEDKKSLATILNDKQFPPKAA